MPGSKDGQFFQELFHGKEKKSKIEMLRQVSEKEQALQSVSCNNQGRV